MNESALVSLDTAARKLGVSAVTMRRWVKRGVIPQTCYLKIGFLYRFDMDRLMEELHPPDTLDEGVEPPPALGGSVAPEETTQLMTLADSIFNDEESDNE